MAANLMRGLIAFCGGVLLGTAASAAQEVLPDPTKPPSEIGALAAPVGRTAAPRERGLQSIIISSSRRAAIINGQLVEQGGRIGDAKLVEVNEGSVVLRRAQGSQVLTLFPGVEISRKESTTAPAVKNKPAGHAAQSKGEGK